MLKDLPEFVQKQLLTYLESSNLAAAKSLHDAWLQHQALQPAPQTEVYNFSTPLSSKDFVPVRNIMLIEEILWSG